MKKDKDGKWVIPYEPWTEEQIEKCFAEILKKQRIKDRVKNKILQVFEQIKQIIPETVHCMFSILMWELFKGLIELVF